MSRIVLALLMPAALHAQQPAAPPPPTDSNAVRIDTAVIHLDPTRDRVFLMTAVTQRPALISGPSLRYPEMLREAGIEGRVLVQAIIDTMGHAEWTSIRVLASPNPLFDDAARDYLERAFFRPARLNGRAVRVLINMPIDFKIRRGLRSSPMAGPP